MGTDAAVLLLGLALSAPAKAPAPAPPTMTACAGYRVLAEKTELAADGEVAGWAAAALERAALLDPESPCFVYVRITSGPIRSGGRQDGWVAHVAVSTRRFLRDGKLVTNEKGMLLVEATKEALAAKAQSFVEESVAALKQRREERAPSSPGGGTG